MGCYIKNVVAVHEQTKSIQICVTTLCGPAVPTQNFTRCFKKGINLPQLFTSFSEVNRSKTHHKMSQVFSTRCSEQMDKFMVGKYFINGSLGEKLKSAKYKFQHQLHFKIKGAHNNSVQSAVHCSLHTVRGQMAYSTRLARFMTS